MHAQPYLWIWLIGAPLVLALISLLRTPAGHRSTDRTAHQRM